MKTFDANLQLYTGQGLSAHGMSADPFQQFCDWFQACLDSNIKEPTAMVLSTVNDNQQPDARVVLLKHYDEEGFVFFSHYHSNKGQQLAQQAKAHCLFWWESLGRQIRIQGETIKLPSEQSDQYFARRTRDSQLAAWSATQSSTLTSRAALLDDFAKQQQRFHQQTIPRPDAWGGYRLVPTQFEFWQGAPHRLHDRFCYTLTDHNWICTRLAP